MIKFDRTDPPVSLKSNYKRWGKELKANLSANEKYEFHWHGCYDEVSQALFEMSANHCCFCDIQPLKQSGATIEHFRPKKKYPLLADVWANLFHCCSNCQKKGQRFDARRPPLKPDRLDFKFEYYFALEETIEEIFICPNPLRSQSEIERAKQTIELYGLNRFARPEARKKELEDFRADQRLGKIKDVNSYSYRFLLK